MLLDRLAPAWERFQEAARAAVRILVVDDEAAIRQVLVELLGSAGYAVDEAEHLGAARAALEGPYDLVVVDKNLPDGSGLDLVSELTEARRRIPCLVITGYPSAATVVDALTAGAVDYLAKPFDDVTHVLARVESVINRRLADQLNGRMVRDLSAALGGEKTERRTVAEVSRQLFAFKRGLGRRPGVLVVEEVPAVAEVVRRTLEAARLNVEVVGDLAAARAWLARPDGPLTALVSVDIPASLPLVRDLRAADPLLEVVVTSGAADTEIALGAVAMGATDYVLRPFEGVEVLRSRMQRAVARARRRRLYLHLLATLYRAATRAGEHQAAFLATLEADARRSPEVPEEGVALEPEEVDLSDLFASEAELEVEVTPVEPAQPQVIFRPAGPEDADLPLVEADAVDGLNRRADRRVEATLEVRFHSPEADAEARFIYSHLRDVSAGGMFIHLQPPLPVGTRLSIEVLLGWSAEPVQVSGEVVRRVDADPKHPGRAGVGVRLSGPGQQALATLVARLAQRLYPG